MSPWPGPWVPAGGALVGLAAGAAYFAALWVTTRRAVRSRRPALVLAASAAVRLPPLLLVFLLLVRWHPLAALAGMAGFLIARRLWTRRTEDAAWN